MNKDKIRSMCRIWHAQSAQLYTMQKETAKLQKEIEELSSTQFQQENSIHAEVEKLRLDHLTVKISTDIAVTLTHCKKWDGDDSKLFTIQASNILQ